MKMRKVISTVLAGVLALSALPISAMSAGAEGAYAPGDVDIVYLNHYLFILKIVQRYKKQKYPPRFGRVFFC